MGVEPVKRKLRFHQSGIYSHTACTPIKNNRKIMGELIFNPLPSAREVITSIYFIFEIELHLHPGYI